MVDKAIDRDGSNILHKLTQLGDIERDKYLIPLCGDLAVHKHYITYDNGGVGTGVHPGTNVISSGLFGNLLSQILGIAFWITILLMYTSPTPAQWWKGCPDPASATTDPPPTTDTRDDDKEENVNVEDEDAEKINFEPLPPNSVVLLSVCRLEHTYAPNCWVALC